MSSLYLTNLAEHQRTFERLAALDADIASAGSLIARCLGSNGKLLSCGNGGSAADSQHIASELTGRFIKERKPLAASTCSPTCSSG